MTVSATTMLGPAGVSNRKDDQIPSATAQQPSNAASAAICSGVRQKRRVAAEGMISSEVINNTPTTFIAIAMTTAINTIRVSCTARTGTPSTRARSSMDGCGKQRTPDHRQHDERSSARDPDTPEIAVGNRQYIAEEIAHQIDANGCEKGERNQSDRERGVGHDPEHGVTREPFLTLRQGQQDRHRYADRHDADHRVDPKHQSKADAEKRGMRQGIAEIGHAPPNDEGAKRPGRDRDTEAR